jgi:holo-[acyl-carrier protein] synthase
VQIVSGIDIVEIRRIEKAIQRWGARFLSRVFTESELSLYIHKPESLAARFAGKEAMMKALGATNCGITWRDVEILSDGEGKPTLNLRGKAFEQMGKLGLTGLEISLSHSRDNAIALVIGLRER